MRIIAIKGLQIVLLALAVSVGQLAAMADRLVLVAGGGVKMEGPATACKLDRPFACGKDGRGTLFIVEMSGRVLAVNRSGQLRRVAGGNGVGNSGDGGPALAAQLNAPHHLLVLANGDVLVADTMNHRVRRIEAKSGRIVPFAGTGTASYGGDGGPATEAQFGAIYCLALDSKRNVLYLDDLDNRRIRKVDMKTGLVTTAAGNGKRGVPMDGSTSVDAPLEDPRAIATDSRGNLYILERGGNALRVVDTDGRIRTVVGTGKPGPAEDGPAMTATLRSPKHLYVDREDNVLIADSDNHCIRKYAAKEKRIVRVAGTGMPGSKGAGGVPTDAQLDQPHGVYIDNGGNVYLCDSWNDRVVRITK